MKWRGGPTIPRELRLRLPEGFVSSAPAPRSTARAGRSRAPDRGCGPPDRPRSSSRYPRRLARAGLPGNTRRRGVVSLRSHPSNIFVIEPRRLGSVPKVSGRHAGPVASRRRVAVRFYSTPVLDLATTARPLSPRSIRPGVTGSERIEDGPLRGAARLWSLEKPC